MVPKTRNFNNARPRGPVGEGSSTVPPDNSIIAKKLLGITTGKIFFSPKEASLVIL